MDKFGYCFLSFLRDFWLVELFRFDGDLDVSLAQAPLALCITRSDTSCDLMKVSNSPPKRACIFCSSPTMDEIILETLLVLLAALPRLTCRRAKLGFKSVKPRFIWLGKSLWQVARVSKMTKNASCLALGGVHASFSFTEVQSSHRRRLRAIGRTCLGCLLSAL